MHWARVEPKAPGLEEEVARRKLPERTILALVDAAIGLRVRNATYRPVAEIHDNLASRAPQDGAALATQGMRFA